MNKNRTGQAEPKALLFDATLCGGCRECVKACMSKQGFEGDPESVTKLSATAYCAIVEQGDYYLRKLCRHCLEPSCASVCPVGALEKTPLGPVVYDVKKCIGCRYCMLACPFNVPCYEWDNPAPAVRKCDLCFDRISEGKIPACAEACMYEATVFGDREEMIALAKERIADDPETYASHICGLDELGGASVLMLLPKGIEAEMCRTDLGNQPLPALTWNVLSKIPGVVTGGSAALLAIWWITKRRDEVALAEGHHTEKENGNGRNAV